MGALQSRGWIEGNIRISSRAREEKSGVIISSLSSLPALHPFARAQPKRPKSPPLRLLERSSSASSSVTSRMVGPSLRCLQLGIPLHVPNPSTTHSPIPVPPALLHHHHIVVLVVVGHGDDGPAAPTASRLLLAVLPIGWCCPAVLVTVLPAASGMAPTPVLDGTLLTAAVGGRPADAGVHLPEAGGREVVAGAGLELLVEVLRLLLVEVDEALLLAEAPVLVPLLLNHVGAVADGVADGELLDLGAVLDLAGIGSGLISPIFKNSEF